MLKFTLRPSLAFSYIGGVTLWPGAGNEITEVSQRAPPIFGWAAITLVIGPHSSFLCSTVPSVPVGPIRQPQSGPGKQALRFDESERFVEHSGENGVYTANRTAVDVM